MCKDWHFLSLLSLLHTHTATSSHTVIRAVSRRTFFVCVVGETCLQQVTPGNPAFPLGTLWLKAAPGELCLVLLLSLGHISLLDPKHANPYLHRQYLGMFQAQNVGAGKTQGKDWEHWRSHGHVLKVKQLDLGQSWHWNGLLVRIFSTLVALLTKLGDQISASCLLPQYVKKGCFPPSLLGMMMVVVIMAIFDFFFSSPRYFITVFHWVITLANKVDLAYSLLVH